MPPTMTNNEDPILLDQRPGNDNYASTVVDDEDGSSLVLDDLVPCYPASGDGCSKETFDETSPNSVGEHGSSKLSKLDMLRARNEKARLHSSLCIEAMRRSFGSNSSSLLAPTVDKAISSTTGSDTPQLDDTSLGTSQSLTWDFDSSPRSVKSRKRPPKVPLQILLRTSQHSAPATATTVDLGVSSLQYYIEHCKRLEEQNDLLRGHIHLLRKHHGLMMIQRDRVIVRREIQNQMKSVARRRIQMALPFFFFLVWLAQTVLSGECSSLATFNEVRLGHHSGGTGTPLAECFATMDALMNTRRTLTPHGSWSKTPSNLDIPDQRKDLLRGIRRLIVGVRQRFKV